MATQGKYITAWITAPNAITFTTKGFVVPAEVEEEDVVVEIVYYAKLRRKKKRPIYREKIAEVSVEVLIGNKIYSDRGLMVPVSAQVKNAHVTRTTQW